MDSLIHRPSSDVSNSFEDAHLDHQAYLFQALKTPVAVPTSSDTTSSILSSGSLSNHTSSCTATQSSSSATSVSNTSWGTSNSDRAGITRCSIEAESRNPVSETTPCSKEDTTYRDQYKSEDQKTLRPSTARNCFDAICNDSVTTKQPVPSSNDYTTAPDSSKEKFNVSSDSSDSEKENSCLHSPPSPCPWDPPHAPSKIHKQIQSPHRKHKHSAADRKQDAREQQLLLRLRAAEPSTVPKSAQQQVQQQMQIPATPRKQIFKSSLAKLSPHPLEPILSTQTFQSRLPPLTQKQKPIDDPWGVIPMTTSKSREGFSHAQNSGRQFKAKKSLLRALTATEHPNLADGILLGSAKWEEGVEASTVRCAARRVREAMVQKAVEVAEAKALAERIALPTFAANWGTISRQWSSDSSTRSSPLLCGAGEVSHKAVGSAARRVRDAMAAKMASQS